MSEISGFIACVSERGVSIESIKFDDEEISGMWNYGGDSENYYHARTREEAFKASSERCAEIIARLSAGILSIGEEMVK